MEYNNGETGIASYPIGHDDKILSFFALAGFYFSHNNGTHILVFVDDWHDEWTVGLAIQGGQTVDERNESWSAIPRANLLVHLILQSLARLAGARQEEQILTRLLV